jgi:hypothetical protein
MLRLLTDNKGKNPTIMLDRGYPNSMYTEATYNVLADIIQGTDLRLGMYSLYNSNRDGKDYFASVKNNLTKGCKLETLIHAHPMTTVMSVNCSTNCNGCMFKTNAKKCVACLSASTCSKQISCKECDAFQRGKAVSGSGYYDDQGGSRANPLGDSSAMQNAYEVYVNIEKNIQLLTKKTINE